MSKSVRQFGWALLLGFGLALLQYNRLVYGWW